MKLTDERIMELWNASYGWSQERVTRLTNSERKFVRAIAAEQRKIDAEICTEESDSGIAKRCAKAILNEGEE